MVGRVKSVYVLHCYFTGFSRLKKQSVKMGGLWLNTLPVVNRSCQLKFNEGVVMLKVNNHSRGSLAQCFHPHVVRSMANLLK